MAVGSHDFRKVPVKMQDEVNKIHQICFHEKILSLMKLKSK